MSKRRHDAKGNKGNSDDALSKHEKYILGVRGYDSDSDDESVGFEEDDFHASVDPFDALPKHRAQKKRDTLDKYQSSTTGSDPRTETKTTGEGLANLIVGAMKQRGFEVKEAKVVKVDRVGREVKTLATDVGANLQKQFDEIRNPKVKPREQLTVNTLSDDKKAALGSIFKPRSEPPKFTKTPDAPSTRVATLGVTSVEHGNLRPSDGLAKANLQDKLWRGQRIREELHAEHGSMTRGGKTEPTVDIKSTVAPAAKPDRAALFADIHKLKPKEDVAAKPIKDDARKALFADIHKRKPKEDVAAEPIKEAAKEVIEAGIDAVEAAKAISDKVLHDTKAKDEVLADLAAGALDAAEAITLKAEKLADALEKAEVEDKKVDAPIVNAAKELVYVGELIAAAANIKAEAVMAAIARNEAVERARMAVAKTEYLKEQLKKSAIEVANTKVYNPDVISSADKLAAKGIELARQELITAHRDAKLREEEVKRAKQQAKIVEEKAQSVIKQGLGSIFG